MAIIDKNNQSIRFSSGKRWNKLISHEGNLMVEYKIDEKVYVITRFDERPFDGITESVGAKFYGNMNEPETLDEVIEYEINSLCCMQIEPEVSMFYEFDWGFNEDKTVITVFSVFLEEGCSTVIALPEPFASNIEVSFGSVKTVRNGNINLDNNKLNLKKR